MATLAVNCPSIAPLPAFFLPAGAANAAGTYGKEILPWPLVRKQDHGWSTLASHPGSSRVSLPRKRHTCPLKASARNWSNQAHSDIRCGRHVNWNNLFGTSKQSSSRCGDLCKCAAGVTAGTMVLQVQPFLEQFKKAIAAVLQFIMAKWDAFQTRLNPGGGIAPLFRFGFVEQQLFVTAVHAALSYVVLVKSHSHLDPNRNQTKKGKERKKEIAKRLGRPMVQTNEYEDIIATDVINPEAIDVTFSSIGGLEDVKASLHELVILPLRRPELFAHGKLTRPQKGVLLYGPPGTGKTLLAKAIAKEARAVFINVRISTLMSKWFGDAEKLATAVFTLAHKLQPAIIFIDEVDSFLSHRRGTENEFLSLMKTEFMALWDGLTTDQNARVMVLAATNRPAALDEAILRRLPRAFEVGLPDQKQRASILQVILKDENVEEGLDIDYLASLCMGYSGSDLTELTKQAAYLPIKDLLQQERIGTSTERKMRPLKQSDFECVLKNSRTSKDAASDYQHRRQARDSVAADGLWNSYNPNFQT